VVADADVADVAANGTLHALDSIVAAHRDDIFDRLSIEHVRRTVRLLARLTRGIGHRSAGSSGV
jgi:hypothetical protein